MPEQKMKKILRINCQTEFKAVKDEGIVEAYVSIFNNIDSDGDIIIRGAFLETLIKKLPVGCWSHNWDEPVAKTLEAREDEKGLYIKGQFILGVQKAKEAFELIKAGVITEFSIGFRILDWEYDDAGHRVIKKVRLFEWSPVLAGANPETEVLNIKSGEDTGFKFLVKKDGEDEPAGIPHVVAPQDLENIPELGEAGVVEGDTIFLPEEDDAEPSPALPEEGKEPETPAIPAEGSGEGDKETPPATEENQNTDELAKSLKEFSQTMNNLIVALTPLAEKIEKSVEGLGTKVNAEPAQTLKVLRLKQATKTIDKNAEIILRILKN